MYNIKYYTAAAALILGVELFDPHPKRFLDSGMDSFQPDNKPRMEQSIYGIKGFVGNGVRIHGNINPY